MSPARRSPSQQRSRDMVEYMLEAATRVFDREGIDATTNRIAEEAGVSIGSLYQYFSDKQDLLRALALRHLDEAEQVFSEAFNESHHDLRSFIKRLVDAAVELHTEHGRFHQVMREFAPRSPDVVKRFEDVMAQIVEQVEKALTDLDVDDPAGRAALAFASIDAQVHTVLTEDTTDETRQRRITLVVDQLMTLLQP